MRISAHDFVASAVPGSAGDCAQRETASRSGFADFLHQSISGLADLQAAADRASQRVAMGDLAHLHEAVVAVQEMSLALEFVVQVRNHLVEGIQELLRTQA